MTTTAVPRTRLARAEVVRCYRALQQTVRTLDRKAREIGIQIKRMGAVEWDRPDRCTEQFVRVGKLAGNAYDLPAARDFRREFKFFIPFFPNPDAAKRLLDFVDHEQAHLTEGLFVHGQLKFGAGKLSSHNKMVVNRFVGVAPDYLVFVHYSYRMLQSLVAQHLNLAVRPKRVRLEPALGLISLSLAIRAMSFNGDFKAEGYTKARVQDAGYCGVLFNVERGLAVTTTEPYLHSILYNLAKNAFKIIVEGPVSENDDFTGAKIVISARRHPKYDNVVVIEVVDNGPGFDLNTIAQQALDCVVKNPDAASGLLPQQTVDMLTRLNSSPYATGIALGSLLDTIFVARLSGFGLNSFSSGLGLWGGSQLAQQMHGAFAVGMNHPGVGPFSSGARFMLLLPKHIRGFLPPSTVLMQDVRYGVSQTPFLT